jgi:hypothetical protein
MVLGKELSEPPPGRPRRPSRKTASTVASFRRKRRGFLWNTGLALQKTWKTPASSPWSAGHAPAWFTGDQTNEIVHYLSSLRPKRSSLPKWRGHWGIENRLHWCLDVILAEDKSRPQGSQPAQPQPDLPLGPGHFAQGHFPQKQSTRQTPPRRLGTASSSGNYSRIFLGYKM